VTRRAVWASWYSLGMLALLTRACRDGAAQGVRADGADGATQTYWRAWLTEETQGIARCNGKRGHTSAKIFFPFHAIASFTIAILLPSPLCHACFFVEIHLPVLCCYALCNIPSYSLSFILSLSPSADAKVSVSNSVTPIMAVAEQATRWFGRTSRCWRHGVGAWTICIRRVAPPATCTCTSPIFLPACHLHARHLKRRRVLPLRTPPPHDRGRSAGGRGRLQAVDMVLNANGGRRAVGRQTKKNHGVARCGGMLVLVTLHSLRRRWTDRPTAMARCRQRCLWRDAGVSRTTASSSSRRCLYSSLNIIG